MGETMQQANDRALREWLDKHHAFPLWDRVVPPGKVTAYNLRGRVVLVVRYANDHGWDLYTPHDSNRIDESLADAETRLGLK